MSTSSLSDDLDLESEFEEDLDDIPLINSDPKFVSSKEAYKLEFYVDTEYSKLGSISLQVFVRFHYLTLLEFSFVILDSEFKKCFSNICISDWELENNCYLFYDNLRGDRDSNFILKYFLLVLNRFYKIEFSSKSKVIMSVSLFFYYSLTDINIAFGPEFMRKQYLLKKPTIIQNRTLGGYLIIINNDYPPEIRFNIVLKDLSGLEKFGLEAMAQTYGIPFKKDRQLDSFKKNMDLAVKEIPLVFLNYGLQDALVLYKIMVAAVVSFNSLMSDSLEIKDPSVSFKFETLPMTIGKLVYKVFKIYLEKVVLKDCLTYQLAMFSHGVLSKMSNLYDNANVFKNTLATIKTLKDLEAKLETDVEFKKQALLYLNNEKVLKYKAYQYAGSKHLTELSVNNSLYTSSFVSGGRVINERPKEVYLENAADLDIQQAYGSTLIDAIYPLGIPRIYTTSEGQSKSLTLGSFMKKNLGNLKNGLYKVIVSGKLTFEQDLIYSRVITEKQIESKVSNWDQTDPEAYTGHVPHVLLKKEIKHGIITHHVWELISKIATAVEFQEFSNLTVESAVYWLDSDRVFTIEDFSQKVFEDKNTIVFDSKKNANNDHRTKAWYGIECSSLVGPLLEKRKVLKKLGTNKGLEQSIKLFINTFYGILASIFFTINNTVVADSITASVRIKAWLMAKALALHIVVTDGGICSLDQVLYLKEGTRKPGFNSLAYFYNFENHRGLYLAPLGGKNWSSIITNNLKGRNLASEVEQESQKHLEAFWKPYNIDPALKMEVKFIIHKGSYISKAHYYLQTLDLKTGEPSETPYFKIRGFKYRESDDYLHPIYYLLKYICENGTLDYNSNPSFNIPWKPLHDGSYIVEKMLRIPGWKKSFSSQDKSRNYVDFLPGDVVSTQYEFRLLNTHFPIMTEKEYLKKSKRGSYTKRGVNKEIIVYPLFERYLEAYGIRTMLVYMEQDKLKRNVLLKNSK